MPSHKGHKRNMLNYALLKNREFAEVIQTYTNRDAILYALGVGFGDDPLDADALGFVYEKAMKAVPSMAAVLGSPGFFWQNADFGVDWVKIVHAEQDVEWFQPMPAAATIIGRNRITTLADKGPGKAVVAEVVRDIFDQASGVQLARARQVTFLRGDGGYSEHNGASDAPPSPLPPIDAGLGAPEREIALPSLPQAALIYRLSGDLNPLHADPVIARAAGFPRPILHGLCTYGMAARAVLAGYAGHDPSRLRRLAVRFTAPVFPGETVSFQFWRLSSQVLRLRAYVPARGVMVLDNGVAEIG
jgi:acyl dehydratase